MAQRLVKERVDKDNQGIKTSEFIAEVDGGRLVFKSPRYPMPNTPHRRSISPEGTDFFEAGAVVPDMKWIVVTPTVKPSLRTALGKSDESTDMTIRESLGIDLPAVNLDPDTDNKNILAVMPANTFLTCDDGYTIPSGK